MFAYDIISKAAKAAGAAGLLLLGACAAETAPGTPGQNSQALLADGSMPRVEAPSSVLQQAGPAWRLKTPTGLIEYCSADTCTEGEECCPLTGECVPAECDDCCVSPENAAGVPPTPELDTPESPPAPQY